MNSGLLLFIIFGAISNLVDRLKFGYVIDYIDIKYFTVFNLADIMIVVGCSVIVLPALLKKNK
jgi:signal peptidase II